ncbi:MAG: T9SS type A sorting domain-containing protein [Bacteroidales bacterium]
MKKIILLILFCINSIYTVNASIVIIQGQLKNSSNNLGIANHTVYVSDSINYYDSFLSTANGYYYLVITGVTPSPGLQYYVTVKDCNNNLHHGIAHSTDTLTTINFSICDTNVVNCQNSFTSSHQNLLYYFFATNTNTYPCLYYWSFGDGSIANGQNPIHTYLQQPSTSVNYSVSLTTQTLLPNFDTCFSISTQIINIPGHNLHISGSVSAGNSNLNSGSVYLYGINNPIGSCILIDTSGLDTSGFYSFTNFSSSYPAYMLKAVLPVNSTLNNFYIPSYYDSLYSWMNSPPVLPDTTNNPHNIYLLPFQPMATGIGSISGNVVLNGNKFFAMSNAEGVEVLLLNQNNKPLRLTTTDNSGIYSFANLAFGIYKVFVEIAGKISTPAIISLSNSNPYAVNIGFVVKGNSIVLALGDIPDLNLQMSELYPNPAKGDIGIDFSFFKSEHLKIRILNQLGEVIQESIQEVAAGNQHFIFNTNDLQSGFYTLQISNAAFTTNRKFVRMK